MARGLNARAGRMDQSAIRTMSIECAAAGGINLAQGICDTGVPPQLANRVEAAISEGWNTYSRFDGNEELRVALAEKMAAHNNLAYDPEGEIVVTNGATGAFYIAASALLNPGDEVLLLEPYYGYHVSTLTALDLKPKFVAMQPPTWELPREELTRAIGPATRAILLNTPANPCGKVFSEEELVWLGELATAHDLWIFTDEVYEHFLYDGRRHVSPASLPGLRERTITMSSLSKTYAITGWRLGWMASDRKWSTAFGCLNDLVYVCPPTPLQVATARGMAALDAEYYSSLAKQHELKRDRLCAALTDAGLTPYVPEGAYYVLANATRLPGSNGWDRARHLLATTGLATVPGEAFFTEGRGGDLLRFCFGKTDAVIEESCRRLREL
jgi:aminotransferase